VSSGNNVMIIGGGFLGGWPRPVTTVPTIKLKGDANEPGRN
jgi:hypothetical protein